MHVYSTYMYRYHNNINFMSTLKDGIQSKAVDDTWGRLIRPAMPVIGDDDDGDDEIAYFSVR